MQGKFIIFIIMLARTKKYYAHFFFSFLFQWELKIFRLIHFVLSLFSSKYWIILDKMRTKITLISLPLYPIKTLETTYIQGCSQFNLAGLDTPIMDQTTSAIWPPTQTTQFELVQSNRPNHTSICDAVWPIYRNICLLLYLKSLNF